MWASAKRVLPTSWEDPTTPFGLACRLALGCLSYALGTEEQHLTSSASPS